MQGIRERGIPSLHLILQRHAFSGGYVPRYTGGSCSASTLRNFTGVLGTAAIPYRTCRSVRYGRNTGSSTPSGKIRYELDADRYPTPREVRHAISNTRLTENVTPPTQSLVSPSIRYSNNAHTTIISFLNASFPPLPVVPTPPKKKERPTKLSKRCVFSGE